MLGKCILCKEKKPIVWHDWEREFGSINLCFFCLAHVMPEEAIPNKICRQCQEPFLIKHGWEKICFDCWKKNKK